MEEQVACLRRLQVAYEEGRKGERVRWWWDGRGRGRQALQMNTISDRTGQDSRQADQADRQVVKYKMVKIEQREGGGREKVVEEVPRLCTYIRGERGWGEINESGLAMQAFCRHSTSRGVWRDRGLAGTWPGRHGRPSRRRNHPAARSVGECSSSK